MFNFDMNVFWTKMKLMASFKSLFGQMGPSFLIILFSKHPGPQLLSTQVFNSRQPTMNQGWSFERNDIWEGFVQFTEFLWKFWWWNCIWNIDKLSLETVTFKLVATASNIKLRLRGFLVPNPAISQYMKSSQWKISAHTLTIKLSPSPARPSIVVISLNNHFEQFLSKQHLFCTSHFLFFVRGTFDTTSCITIIIVMNNTFYTLLYHHSSHRKMSLTVLLWEIKLLVPLQTVSPET